MDGDGLGAVLADIYGVKNVTDIMAMLKTDADVATFYNVLGLAMKTGYVKNGQVLYSRGGSRDGVYADDCTKLEDVTSEEIGVMLKDIYGTDNIANMLARLETQAEINSFFTIFFMSMDLVSGIRRDDKGNLIVERQPIVVKDEDGKVIEVRFPDPTFEVLGDVMQQFDDALSLYPNAKAFLGEDDSAGAAWTLTSIARQRGYIGEDGEGRIARKVDEETGIVKDKGDLTVKQFVDIFAQGVETIDSEMGLVQFLGSEKSEDRAILNSVLLFPCFNAYVDGDGVLRIYGDKESDQEDPYVGEFYQNMVTIYNMEVFQKIKNDAEIGKMLGVDGAANFIIGLSMTARDIGGETKVRIEGKGDIGDQSVTAFLEKIYGITGMEAARAIIAESTDSVPGMASTDTDYVPTKDTEGLKDGWISVEELLNNFYRILSTSEGYAGKDFREAFTIPADMSMLDILNDSRYSGIVWYLGGNAHEIAEEWGNDADIETVMKVINSMVGIMDKYAREHWKRGFDPTNKDDFNRLLYLAKRKHQTGIDIFKENDFSALISLYYGTGSERFLKAHMAEAGKKEIEGTLRSMRSELAAETGKLLTHLAVIQDVLRQLGVEGTTVFQEEKDGKIVELSDPDEIIDMLWKSVIELTVKELEIKGKEKEIRQLKAGKFGVSGELFWRLLGEDEEYMPDPRLPAPDKDDLRSILRETFSGYNSFTSVSDPLKRPPTQGGAPAASHEAVEIDLSLPDTGSAESSRPRREFTPEQQHLINNLLRERERVEFALKKAFGEIASQKFGIDQSDTIVLAGKAADLNATRETLGGMPEVQDYAMAELERSYDAVEGAIKCVPPKVWKNWGLNYSYDIARDKVSAGAETRLLRNVYLLNGLKDPAQKAAVTQVLMARVARDEAIVRITNKQEKVKTAYLNALVKLELAGESVKIQTEIVEKEEERYQEILEETYMGEAEETDMEEAEAADMPAARIASRQSLDFARECLMKFIIQEARAKAALHEARITLAQMGLGAAQDYLKAKRQIKEQREVVEEYKSRIWFTKGEDSDWRQKVYGLEAELKKEKKALKGLVAEQDRAEENLVKERKMLARASDEELRQYLTRQIEESGLSHGDAVFQHIMDKIRTDIDKLASGAADNDQAVPDLVRMLDPFSLANAALKIKLRTSAAGIEVSEEMAKVGVGSDLLVQSLIAYRFSRILQLEAYGESKGWIIQPSLTISLYDPARAHRKEAGELGVLLSSLAYNIVRNEISGEVFEKYETLRKTLIELERAENDLETAVLKAEACAADPREKTTADLGVVLKRSEVNDAVLNVHIAWVDLLEARGISAGNKGTIQDLPKDARAELAPEAYDYTMDKMGPQLWGTEYVVRRQPDGTFMLQMEGEKDSGIKTDMDGIFELEGGKYKVTEKFFEDTEYTIDTSEKALFPSRYAFLEGDDGSTIRPSLRGDFEIKGKEKTFQISYDPAQKAYEIKDPSGRIPPVMFRDDKVKLNGVEYSLVHTRRAVFALHYVFLRGSDGSTISPDSNGYFNIKISKDREYRISYDPVKEVHVIKDLTGQTTPVIRGNKVRFGNEVSTFVVTDLSTGGAVIAGDGKLRLGGLFTGADEAELAMLQSLLYKAQAEAEGKSDGAIRLGVAYNVLTKRFSVTPPVPDKLRPLFTAGFVIWQGLEGLLNPYLAGVAGLNAYLEYRKTGKVREANRAYFNSRAVEEEKVAGRHNRIMRIRLNVSRDNYVKALRFHHMALNKKNIWLEREKLLEDEVEKREAPERDLAYPRRNLAFWNAFEKECGLLLERARRKLEEELVVSGRSPSEEALPEDTEEPLLSEEAIRREAEASPERNIPWLQRLGRTGPFGLQAEMEWDGFKQEFKPSAGLEFQVGSPSYEARKVVDSTAAKLDMLAQAARDKAQEQLMKAVYNLQWTKAILMAKDDMLKHGKHEKELVVERLAEALQLDLRDKRILEVIVDDIENEVIRAEKDVDKAMDKLRMLGGSDEFIVLGEYLRGVIAGAVEPVLPALSGSIDAGNNPGVQAILKDIKAFDARIREGSRPFFTFKVRLQRNTFTNDDEFVAGISRVLWDSDKALNRRLNELERQAAGLELKKEIRDIGFEIEGMYKELDRSRESIKEARVSLESAKISLLWAEKAYLETAINVEDLNRAYHVYALRLSQFVRSYQDYIETAVKLKAKLESVDVKVDLGLDRLAAPQKAEKTEKIEKAVKGTERETAEAPGQKGEEKEAAAVQEEKRMSPEQEEELRKEIDSRRKEADEIQRDIKELEKERRELLEEQSQDDAVIEEIKRELKKIEKKLGQFKSRLIKGTGNNVLSSYAQAAVPGGAGGIVTRGIDWVLNSIVSGVEAATPARVPVRFGKVISVNLTGSLDEKLVKSSLSRSTNFTGKRLRVKIEVPSSFVKRPFSAIQLYAKDGKWKWQNTTWADGRISHENPNYKNGILTLTYKPTPPDENEQGFTADGFDPETGIRELGIKVGTPGAAGKSYQLKGEIKVLGAWIEDVVGTAPAEKAIVTPLLRKKPVKFEVITPEKFVTGVSRYFNYGDLSRNIGSSSAFTRTLSELKTNVITGLRLMPAFDIRSGISVGKQEFRNMQQYLAKCGEANAKHNIVTLFDAAISNPTLKQAISDPDGRGKKLIDAIRPFIRKFGAAKINGEPIVYDLVNEISGLGGVTIREKQRFVESIIDGFVEEAPGATVTIGLENYKQMRYWLHLINKYKNKNIKFLVSFHLYKHDIAQLPARGELNIPEGVEVWITEADARKGVERQIRIAIEKGYDGLYFWQDKNFSYSAGEHGRVMDKLIREEGRKEPAESLDRAALEKKKAELMKELKTLERKQAERKRRKTEIAGKLSAKKAKLEGVLPPAEVKPEKPVESKKTQSVLLDETAKAGEMKGETPESVLGLPPVEKPTSERLKKFRYHSKPYYGSEGIHRTRPEHYEERYTGTGTGEQKGETTGKMVNVRYAAENRVTYSYELYGDETIPYYVSVFSEKALLGAEYDKSVVPDAELALNEDTGEYEVVLINVSEHRGDDLNISFGGLEDTLIRSDGETRLEKQSADIPVIKVGRRSDEYEKYLYINRKLGRCPYCLAYKFIQTAEGNNFKPFIDLVSGALDEFNEFEKDMGKMPRKIYGERTLALIYTLVGEYLYEEGFVDWDEDIFKIADGVELKAVTGVSEFDVIRHILNICFERNDLTEFAEYAGMAAKESGLYPRMLEEWAELYDVPLVGEFFAVCFPDRTGELEREIDISGISLEILKDRVNEFKELKKKLLRETDPVEIEKILFDIRDSYAADQRDLDDILDSFRERGGAGLATGMDKLDIELDDLVSRKEMALAQMKKTLDLLRRDAKFIEEISASAGEASLKDNKELRERLAGRYRESNVFEKQIKAVEAEIEGYGEADSDRLWELAARRMELKYRMLRYEVSIAFIKENMGLFKTGRVNDRVMIVLNWAYRIVKADDGPKEKRKVENEIWEHISRVRKMRAEEYARVDIERIKQEEYLERLDNNKDVIKEMDDVLDSSLEEFEKNITELYQRPSFEDVISSGNEWIRRRLYRLLAYLLPNTHITFLRGTLYGDGSGEIEKLERDGGKIRSKIEKRQAKFDDKYFELQRVISSTRRDNVIIEDQESANVYTYKTVEGKEQQRPTMPLLFSLLNDVRGGELWREFQNAFREQNLEIENTLKEFKKRIRILEIASYKLAIGEALEQHEEEELDEKVEGASGMFREILGLFNAMGSSFSKIDEYVERQKVTQQKLQKRLLTELLELDGELKGVRGRTAVRVNNARAVLADHVRACYAEGGDMRDSLDNLGFVFERYCRELGADGLEEFIVGVRSFLAENDDLSGYFDENLVKSDRELNIIIGAREVSLQNIIDKFKFSVEYNVALSDLLQVKENLRIRQVAVEVVIEHYIKRVNEHQGGVRADIKLRELIERYAGIFGKETAEALNEKIRGEVEIVVEEPAKDVEDETASARGSFKEKFMALLGFIAGHTKEIKALLGILAGVLAAVAIALKLRRLRGGLGKEKSATPGDGRGGDGPISPPEGPKKPERPEEPEEPEEPVEEVTEYTSQEEILDALYKAQKIGAVAVDEANEILALWLRFQSLRGFKKARRMLNNMEGVLLALEKKGVIKIQEFLKGIGKDAKDVNTKDLMSYLAGLNTSDMKRINSLVKNVVTKYGGLRDKLAFLEYEMRYYREEGTEESRLILAGLETRAIKLKEKINNGPKAFVNRVENWNKWGTVLQVAGTVLVAACFISGIPQADLIAAFWQGAVALSLGILINYRQTWTVIKRIHDNKIAFLFLAGGIYLVNHFLVLFYPALSALSGAWTVLLAVFGGIWLWDLLSGRIDAEREINTEICDVIDKAVGKMEPLLRPLPDQVRNEVYNRPRRDDRGRLVGREGRLKSREELTDEDKYRVYDLFKIIKELKEENELIKEEASNRKWWFMRASYFSKPDPVERYWRKLKTRKWQGLTEYLEDWSRMEFLSNVLLVDIVAQQEEAEIAAVEHGTDTVTLGQISEELGNLRSKIRNKIIKQTDAEDSPGSFEDYFINRKITFSWMSWKRGFVPLIARYGTWGFITGLIAFFAWLGHKGAVLAGQKMAFHTLPLLNLIPVWRVVFHSWYATPLVALFVIMMGLLAWLFIHNVSLSVWTIFPWMNKTSMVRTYKKDLEDALFVLDQSVRLGVIDSIWGNIDEKKRNKLEGYKEEIDRLRAALAGLSPEDESSKIEMETEIDELLIRIFDKLDYEDLFGFMVRQIGVDEESGLPVFAYDGYLYLLLANMPETNIAERPVLRIDLKDDLVTALGAIGIGKDELESRNGGVSAERLTTLDITSKLTFEEIEEIKRRVASVSQRTERKKLSGDEIEIGERLKSMFPRVTLVVSAYGEEEVVGRVMKTIVSSGYPGTYAIIAGEAKDMKTIPVIKENMEKHPELAHLVSLSLTPTRPNNMPARLGLFKRLFFKKTIPSQVDQTKPDADNTANVGLEQEKKSPYSFNLIDVEDAPQSRYLWEQTMGMMMTESTLLRLAERLRKGEGISPGDIRRSLKEADRKLRKDEKERDKLRKELKGQSADKGRVLQQLREKNAQTREDERKLRQIKMLQFNIKRWNIDTNIDALKNVHLFIPEFDDPQVEEAHIRFRELQGEMNALRRKSERLRAEGRAEAVQIDGEMKNLRGRMIKAQEEFARLKKDSDKKHAKDDRKDTKDKKWFGASIALPLLGLPFLSNLPGIPAFASFKAGMGLLVTMPSGGFIMPLTALVAMAGLAVLALSIISHRFARFSANWQGTVLFGVIAYMLSPLLGGIGAVPVLISIPFQINLGLIILVFCISNWLINTCFVSTRGVKDEETIKKFIDRNKPVVIQTALLQKPYSGTANPATALNYKEWFSVKLPGFVSQRSPLSILGMFYGAIDMGVYVWPHLAPLLSSLTAAVPYLWIPLIFAGAFLTIKYKGAGRSGGVGLMIASLTWLSAALVGPYGLLAALLIIGVYGGGAVLGTMGLWAGFVNKITAIPLGGTGNNFDFARFVAMGLHDGTNVTEDLDLGMRILVSGRRVMMLDGPETEVQEDTQPHLGPARWWQVARWEIGHLVTGYMFFTRLPFILLRLVMNGDLLGAKRLIFVSPAVFTHLIIATFSGIFTVLIYGAAELFLLSQFVFPLFGAVPGIGAVLLELYGVLGGGIPALFPYITTAVLGLIIFSVSYGVQLLFGEFAVIKNWSKYPSQARNQVEDLKAEKRGQMLKSRKEGKEADHWVIEGVERRIDDLSNGRLRLPKPGRRCVYYTIVFLSMVWAVVGGYLWVLGSPHSFLFAPVFIGAVIMALTVFIGDVLDLMAKPAGESLYMDLSDIKEVIKRVKSGGDNHLNSRLSRQAWEFLDNYYRGEEVEPGLKEVLLRDLSGVENRSMVTANSFGAVLKIMLVTAAFLSTFLLGLPAWGMYLLSGIFVMEMLENVSQIKGLRDLTSLTFLFGEKTGRQLYMFIYWSGRNFYNLIFGMHFSAAVWYMFKQVWMALDSTWSKTAHPLLSNYTPEFKDIFRSPRAGTGTWLGHRWFNLKEWWSCKALFTQAFIIVFTWIIVLSLWAIITLNIFAIHYRNFFNEQTTATYTTENIKSVTMQWKDLHFNGEKSIDRFRFDKKSIEENLRSPNAFRRDKFQSETLRNRVDDMGYWEESDENLSEADKQLEESEERILKVKDARSGTSLKVPGEWGEKGPEIKPKKGLFERSIVWFGMMLGLIYLVKMGSWLKQRLYRGAPGEGKEKPRKERGKESDKVEGLKGLRPMEPVKILGAGLAGAALIGLNMIFFALTKIAPVWCLFSVSVIASLVGFGFGYEAYRYIKARTHPDNFGPEKITWTSESEPRAVRDLREKLNISADIRILPMEVEPISWFKAFMELLLQKAPPIIKYQVEERTPAIRFVPGLLKNKAYLEQALLHEKSESTARSEMKAVWAERKAGIRSLPRVAFNLPWVGLENMLSIRKMFSWIKVTVTTIVGLILGTMLPDMIEGTMMERAVQGTTTVSSTQAEVSPQVVSIPVDAGWKAQTYENSRGIEEVKVDLDNSQLVLQTNLIDGHPNNSQGEVLLDFRYADFPGLAKTPEGFVDMTDTRFTLLVNVPEGYIETNSGASHMVQLFFKSGADWKNLYAKKVNLTVPGWFKLVADPGNDPVDSQDPDFNWREVVAVGFKLEAPGADYMGEFYLKEMKLKTVLPSKPVQINEFILRSGRNLSWDEVNYGWCLGRNPWGGAHGGFSSVEGRQKLRDAFTEIKAAEGNTARTFLFGDFRTALIYDANGVPVAFDDKVYPDMRALLEEAQNMGISLIVSLIDFMVADGVSDVNGVMVGEHPEFFTDQDVQDGLFVLLEQFVTDFCGHPNIEIVETMNEPEHAGAVNFSLVRDFNRRLIDLVHTHAPNKAVTVGSNNRTNAIGIWESQLSQGDVVTFHWYPHMESILPFEYSLSSFDADDKPVLLTEVGATSSEDIPRFMTTDYAENHHSGILFWNGDGYGWDDSAYKGWVDEHVQTPVIPTLDPIDTVTGVTAVITWNAVDYAGGYEVSVTDPIGNATSYWTNDISLELSGLQDGATYWIKVQAWTGISESDKGIASGWSEVASFNVEFSVEAPAIPELTPIGTVTGDTAVIAWDQAENAGGYELFVADNANFNNATSYWTNDISLELSGLQDGATYWIKVQAWTGISESDKGIGSGYSETTSFNVEFPAEAPTIPELTPIGTVTGDTAVIAWDQAENAGGYELFVADNANFNNATSYWTNDISLELSGLQDDATYWIKVQAWTGTNELDKGDASGWSAVTNFNVEFSVEVPAIPELMPIGTVTGDTAVITWNDVANAGGYEVSVTDSIGNTRFYWMNDISLELSGLQDGATYWIKIQACTGTNELDKGIVSGWGEPTSFNVKIFEEQVNIMLEDVHNYPNPFSPDEGTKIRINISRGEVSSAELKIFDLAGDLVLKRKAETPDKVDEKAYEILWDGRNGRGETAANGVYLGVVTVKDTMGNVEKQVIKIAVLKDTLHPFRAISGYTAAVTAMMASVGVLSFTITGGVLHYIPVNLIWMLAALGLYLGWAAAKYHILGYAAERAFLEHGAGPYNALHGAIVWAGVNGITLHQAFGLIKSEKMKQEIIKHEYVEHKVLEFFDKFWSLRHLFADTQVAHKVAMLAMLPGIGALVTGLFAGKSAEICSPILENEAAREIKFEKFLRFEKFVAVPSSVYEKLTEMRVDLEVISRSVGVDHLIRLESVNHDDMLKELSDQTYGRKAVCALLDETAVTEMISKIKTDKINIQELRDLLGGLMFDFTAKAEKDMIRLMNPEVVKLTSETIEEISGSDDLRGIATIYARLWKNAENLDFMSKSVFDMRINNMHSGILSGVKLSGKAGTYVLRGPEKDEAR
ncbi:MAG: TolC family protein, partial [Candidatus Omnitrophica bacterium]|nr:TolC family protein [Candidatus Omnitrophota bacterium]